MVTYETPRDVVFRELEGELVLLNLATGFYYGLDAVGARAYQLLSERLPLHDVVSRMLGEFEVSPERLHADLEALVKDLCEHGLLQTGSAA